ncbi:MAG: GWxTD domain-containing protein [bacterium]
MKRLLLGCATIFLILLATVTTPLQAQVQPDSANAFQFDLLSFETAPPSSDSARVDLFVAVPYTWLKFLDATEKYVADYQVSIRISEQKSSAEIQNRKQEFSVTLPQAEREKLNELDLTRADASQYSFKLVQGKEYRTLIEVKDLTSNRVMMREREFTVAQFALGSPVISDILLYKSKTNNHILPHIGTDITTLKFDEAGLFFELYNAPQSVPFWLMQRISSIGEAEEVSRSVSVLVSNGQKRMPIFLPFIRDDLWSGNYQLELFLLPDATDTLLLNSADLRSRALAYRTHPIEVAGVRGVPLAGLDLDEAIAQLAYIAYGSAYDSLMHAESKSEKRRAITEFWDKMNWYHGVHTTRPMEVFYQRVRYANEHFKGLGPGWHGDRGKVYIMLGAPTYMDKHPYGATNKPYEIWKYYDLNEQFYFSDEFMFGDYRLVSTTPVPGTFLWQRESY